MIGHSAVEFIHPDDLDNTREEMRSARRGRHMRNFETRYVHRDGQAVTLTWMGTWSEPVRRHFFVGRDLTEKLAAEAQFRQAQKMEAVGQLTGGVAHDFNNILTVITGTIGILADAVADRPQLTAVARMIDEAAERGASLTRHLLAFARKQPLQPREVDVNALVLETAKLLQPTVGQQIEIAPLIADRRMDGFGRSEPARHRDPEPRPECPRRHGRRRQDSPSRPTTSISTKPMPTCTTRSPRANTS